MFWCHQNDGKRNVLWIVFVGETFTSLISFWPDRVPGDHRSSPTFLSSNKHREAAERDCQVRPQASRPVLPDAMNQLHPHRVYEKHPGQEVLTSEQCVRSHCAGWRSRWASGWRRARSTCRTRRGFRLCVIYWTPVGSRCGGEKKGSWDRSCRFHSHSLRLPENYIPSLLPSKAEYNEQRPQETGDGVTHSRTGPLRTQTPAKPEGGGQAEHLARDKVHLRRSRTGTVQVLCPHHTHTRTFSNRPEIIHNRMNKGHETELLPNFTYILNHSLRTSPRSSPDPEEFPGTCWWESAMCSP